MSGEYTTTWDMKYDWNFESMKGKRDTLRGLPDRTMKMGVGEHTMNISSSTRQMWIQGQKPDLKSIDYGFK